MSLSAEMLCFLFCCGGIGGFIDSIAGGGGLITVPALLAAGLPPQLALGTNKAQSSLGTMVAVTRYVRGGLIDWPQVRGAAMASFLASAVGAWAVSLLSNDLLRDVVPWLLLTIVAYVMFSPKLGERSGQARLSAGAFGLLFGSTLGFYDGFFGPGTGAFWTIATVTLLGLELRRATAYTKVVNLASNLGSLCVFAYKGAVVLPVAAVMVAGQLIGTYLGSGLVLTQGAPLIRRIFLLVVIAIVLRLLMQ
jgi:uncharacterized membrane protein YfcA